MKRLFAVILFIALLGPLFVYAGSQTTSGVTVQDMIDRARRDLNEVTATSGNTGFWRDQDFIQWADEAVKEIVYKTRCLESGSSKVILQANTWSYSIVGSYLDIEAVIYDSGDTTSKTQIYTLERTDIKNIGHNQEGGKPKVFTIWNDELVVWPPPRSTHSGTTLHVYMASLPSGVSLASHSIETPTYFDSAILDYMEGKAYLKEKKETLGLFYLTRFAARIEEYLQKVLKRLP